MPDGLFVPIREIYLEMDYKFELDLTPMLRRGIAEKTLKYLSNQSFQFDLLSKDNHMMLYDPLDYMKQNGALTAENKSPQVVI